MKTFFKRPLWLCIFPLLFVFSSMTHAKDSSIIIFDASGSMKKQIDGKPKFEIAREVMSNLVSNWHEDIDLGLMVYGHRSKACDDIEMVIPVGALNADEFLKAIKGINPKGETPIAESMKQAAEKLNYEESPTTVILISDGEESCNADPCAMAKELEKSGTDFTAHVIGFDVSGEKQAKALEQLKCVAKSTGGKFIEAKDSESLKKALVETAKVIAKPEPVSQPASISTMKVVKIEPHGVNNPQSAELGVIYKFTLKQNEESFFQLSTPLSNGKVSLDMLQANGKSTNIQGSLSILDEDGIGIKKGSISFNAIDVSRREGMKFSSKEAETFGFRVVNTNSNSVIYWLAAMEESDSKIIPFFGKISPKSLVLGKNISGKDKDKSFAYHSIYLTKGTYKAITEITNYNGKNTNISGYLAILTADGFNQSELIDFNEIDVSARKATAFSIKKDGAYIMKVSSDVDPIKYNLKIRKK